MFLLPLWGSARRSVHRTCPSIRAPIFTSKTHRRRPACARSRRWRLPCATGRDRGVTGATGAMLDEGTLLAVCHSAKRRWAQDILKVSAGRPPVRSARSSMVDEGCTRFTPVARGWPGGVRHPASCPAQDPLRPSDTSPGGGGGGRTCAPPFTGEATAEPILGGRSTGSEARRRGGRLPGHPFGRDERVCGQPRRRCAKPSRPMPRPSTAIAAGSGTAFGVVTVRRTPVESLL